MSARSITVDQLVNELWANPDLYNLRDQLELLSTQSSNIDTAKVVRRWLSNMQITAELMGIINPRGYLTTFGEAVVRQLKGEVTSKFTTPQQLLRRQALAPETVEALRSFNLSLRSHSTVVASLSEIIQEDLVLFGIVDEDWRLTLFGRELVRDLNWHW